MSAYDIKSVFDKNSAEIFQRSIPSTHMIVPSRPVQLVPRPARKKIIDVKPREVRQHALHLSHAVKETLEPGERVLGVARFHYMYTVYSVLISGMLWYMSGPVGKQFQLFGLYMAFYLEKFRQVSENTDYMQWSAILTLLGEHSLAEVMALLAALKWVQMTGAFGYEHLHSFLLGNTLAAIPFYICRMAGITFFIWRLLRRWTTEILITDHRFIFKRGILIVRTLKTHLAHLSQVDVNQSWLGNLMGYGWVHIYTRAFENVGDKENERLGVQEIYLPAIAKPHYFSSLIDVAKTRGATENMDSIPPSKESL